jgi:hypothetical protein
MKDVNISIIYIVLLYNIFFLLCRFFHVETTKLFYFNNETMIIFKKYQKLKQ